MSTETKRPLADAVAAADAFRAQFGGSYERWEVAGSVRRRREFVGDIEHVVIPKFDLVVPPGEMLPRDFSLVLKRREELLERGVLSPHIYTCGKRRWGDRYFGADHGGWRHEVFVAEPHTWGYQLVIRTGPADFGHTVMAWIRQRSGTLECAKGAVRYRKDGSVFATPTEADFLHIAGLPDLAPTDRDAWIERHGAVVARK